MINTIQKYFSISLSTIISMIYRQLVVAILVQELVYILCIMYSTCKPLVNLLPDIKYQVIYNIMNMPAVNL